MIGVFQKMLRWSGVAFWCCAVMSLVSCYVPPEQGGSPQAQESRQSADRRDAEQEQAEWLRQDNARGSSGSQQQQSPQGWGSGGVNSLARKARAAFNAGDYKSAEENLEAALAQDPGRQVLIQQLAAVNYAIKNYQRTERLALRAVNLGGNNVEVLRESWWLVAAARKELGDINGSRQAAEIAKGFE